MFRTLLIANRGEIACRIIATARRMGIRTVAVYSDADAAARHVRLADVAVRIGPAAALASYLDIAAVLDAARATGAEAIHPGYGFLSENAEFAAACADAGYVFVGPTPAAIRAMGSKSEAKALVAAAGTPVVPGYHGDDQSDARLSAEAQTIGFPLLVKASAGGGGKGMRLVTTAGDFPTALASARREARAAFDDDKVLLERYLAAPKHLEVQILADATGHTIHLFERDCSVQRRHQKVIEEAPGPTVTPELRALLGAAAVRAAKAIGYLGAGTVEFIAEGAGFHFMEMNTRLQVEHPVTEAITGLDLVEWQLRIAAGEHLTIDQQDVRAAGHAIEARVYAENPRAGFLPSTGRLLHVAFPAGVRVDSGVATGDEVTVHYDPMLAKVIAHGADRAAAVAALDAALGGTEIAGVEHNVAFLRRLLADPAFLAGTYTTGLIEHAGDRLLPAPDRTGALLATLAVQRQASGPGVWDRADGFRINGPGLFRQSLRFERTLAAVCIEGARAQVDAQRYRIDDVVWEGARVGLRLDGEQATARVLISGNAVYVMRSGATERWMLPDAAADLTTVGGVGGRVTSPMPGQVIAVAVAVGDAVTEGAPLVVVEAMKMEHTLRAPRDGRVAAIACAVGARVEEGVELVVLEDPETPQASAGS
jgi:3-methylcrotonyl-CoA carboxylase alpha subunit